jgi:HEAT repeat protein
MTACYAKDRREALHKLGDDYECRCHPEIMKAFICGLNDTDEKVRQKAADEIGDQLRDNSCCCSPELTSALTCALGDCDRGVRSQAEEALEACGYEVVDGCCEAECCEA